jgi:hypothetical protein
VIWTDVASPATDLSDEIARTARDPEPRPDLWLLSLWLLSWLLLLLLLLLLLSLAAANRRRTARHDKIRLEDPSGRSAWKIRLAEGCLQTTGYGSCPATVCHGMPRLIRDRNVPRTARSGVRVLLVYRRFGPCLLETLGKPKNRPPR